MDWARIIQKSIDYIETNIFNDINYDEIAKQMYSSSFHFHRAFSMITGITIGEYIRNRKLTLAGQELFIKKAKVVDIALKYGYESPESFTKAFTRFHGINPSEARIKNSGLKIYNPLMININLNGGINLMKQKSNQFWREDSYCNEKIIAAVTVEGVEFTIIEKRKTIYTGSYFVAPDLVSEPDCGASWQWYQDNKSKIIDSYTPECMICLSIDYTTSERPCAMLHGQETSHLNQPEGFHIIEAEPTLIIKIKSTDAAWALVKKLTGYDNPGHMSPLFFLINNIFCESDIFNFERNTDNGKGNYDAEYYYSNGEQYAAVPVKTKI